MHYIEDDSISYSTSCIPPETNCGGDNNIDVKHTVIKFPTLFGTSLGFTRVEDFWRKDIIDRKHHKFTESKNKLKLRRAASVNEPLRPSYRSNYNLNKPRPLSTAKFHQNQAKRASCKYPLDLNQKVYYYNLPPSLPKEYNPRSQERSKAFNKQMLAISNRNNSNISVDDLNCLTVVNSNFLEEVTNNNSEDGDESVSNIFEDLSLADINYDYLDHIVEFCLDTNIINNKNEDENDNDEVYYSNLDDVVEFCLDTNINNANETDWIELFFQFPDGHKMKFKTRKRAMLKYAFEAFSSRMGYSSIHDLKFKFKEVQLYQNETPISLSMKTGDVILVENRT